MSEPTIPPPDAKPYIEARIGSMNYRGDGLRCLWDGNGRNEDAQAVLTELHRRFHAAESERDRLAERLRRAEELLQPFANFASVFFASRVRGLGDEVYSFFSRNGHVSLKASDCAAAAAFLAESYPTEKKA